MRIIPAIDIIEGQCVRLQMGDYTRKKVYDRDPLAVARQFEVKGVQYLHLVDLDGARKGKVTNWGTLEKLAQNTGLTIDVGGGIRTREEVKRILELGIAQVNIGSLAVKEPETLTSWMAEFGPEYFILSVDIKDGRIATHGWHSTSDLGATDFINSFVDAGLQYVVSTDISRDGMMSGTNLDLYRELVSKYPELKIVASGGISNEKDILDLLPVGVDGVIVGKAIYEGTVNLENILPKC